MIFIFVFVCLHLLARDLVLGLMEIPDHFKADSEMIYLTPTLANMYSIEEIVDRQDGSIRLDVANMTETFERKDFQIYYRLKENELYYRDESDLVVYNSRIKLCKSESIITWYLKDLSVYIREFLALPSDQLDSSSLRKDRTAIGPTALLRLIYANAALFVLDSRAFDELNLCQNYYFSRIVRLKEAAIRIIISLSKFDVDGKQKDDEAGTQQELVIDLTTLAEIKSRVQASRVALIYYENNESDAEILEKTSADLMSFDQIVSNNSHLTRLFISYTLIQERSFSRHMGGSPGPASGAYNYIGNPFTMPNGAGCAVASSHNPFKVRAKQFSGRYEASGYYDHFFIAYDEPTKHLRHDSIGEHRIIYSLGAARATYISAASAESDGLVLDNDDDSGTELPMTENLEFEQDHEHCGQTYVRLLDSQDLGKQMEDILGLGEKVSLFYLGTTSLEDVLDDNAMFHVFEREIGPSEVPLIFKLNMRTKPTLNSRLFINFYFTNEQINGFDIFKPGAFKSMWLERLDLWSLSASSLYKYLSSRLTFTSFSWDLETMPSGDREAKDLHPVRMFDTLECSSIDQQTKLEMFVKQLDDKTWFDKRNELRTIFDNGSRNEIFLNPELETNIEESMLEFILKRTRLERQFVNDITIKVLDNNEVAEEDDDDADNGEHLPLINFIVEAKLTWPMTYKHESFLLGWITEYENGYHSQDAPLIKQKPSMLIHECLLRLTTSLANGGRQIHMLFCPNIGCGYIRNLNGFKYTKKDGSNQEPRKDVYFNMCEVYLVRPSMDPTSMLKNAHSIEQIKQSLDQARLSLTLMMPGSGDNDDDKPANAISRYATSNTYRAIVSKLAITRALSHDNWDTKLVNEICFTKATRFTAPRPESVASELDSLLTGENKLEDTNSDEVNLDNYDQPIRVIQLALHEHHSRIQCHKACLMYAFCSTYTYNLATGGCSLSNIPAKLVRSSNSDYFENIESNKQCSMYELNTLLLYDHVNQMFYTSAKGLSSIENVYLLRSSLDSCAKLCHLNELSHSRSHCQAFRYWRVHSICALESTLVDPESSTSRQMAAPKLIDVGDNADQVDTDSGQDKSFITEEKLLEIVGEQHWDAFYPLERYKRDYAQHFLIKFSTKIKLNQPRAATPITNQLDTSTGSTTEQATGILLSGITLEHCLRYCTIVDLNCVMVDYCSRLNRAQALIQTCQLYHIRSPFTVDGEHSKLKQATDAELRIQKLNLAASEVAFNGVALTSLEAKFYLVGESNEEYSVALKRDNCRHFYLDGDNLLLKRLVANSVESSTRSTSSMQDKLEQIIENISHQDADTSETFIQQLKRYTETLGDHYLMAAGDVYQSNGNRFLFAGLQLFVGLSLGFIIFINQPKIQATIQQLRNHPDCLSWWSQGISSLSLGDLWSRYLNVGRGSEQPRRSGRPRSASQVEINEMVDMGIDDDDVY